MWAAEGRWGYIHPELHIYSTFHVPWGLQVGTTACVFQLDVVMFCGLQTSGFETEAKESHGTGEAERPWNGLPVVYLLPAVCRVWNGCRGLEPMIFDLQDALIQPLASVLFPLEGGSRTVDTGRQIGQTGAF